MKPSPFLSPKKSSHFVMRWKSCSMIWGSRWSSLSTISIGVCRKLQFPRWRQFDYCCFCDEVLLSSQLMMSSSAVLYGCILRVLAWMTISQLITSINLFKCRCVCQDWVPMRPKPIPHYCSWSVLTVMVSLTLKTLILRNPVSRRD